MWGSGGLARRLAAIDLSRPAAVLRPKVIGYELAWTPLLVSRLLHWLGSLNRAPWAAQLEHRRGDLTKVLAELPPGALLICYLCPAQMARLSATLQRTVLPPRVTLISILFALPDFKEAERRVLPTIFRDPLYRYQLSAIESVRDAHTNNPKGRPAAS